MNPHLLVAEVDKIQSFIFRSSKLREVVGASYMLTDFSSSVPDKDKLNVPAADVLTSKGGSFRLVFPSYAEAAAAGEKLRRMFEAEIGGSITIAVPVPYDANTPKDSIKAGNDALRLAKTGGRAPIPVWHLPYQALCQSCGVEYATHHKARFEGDEALHYCDTCTLKAQKAHETRKDPHKSEFLSPIIKAIKDAAELEGQGEPLTFVDDGAYDADTYAGGDGFVAYLAADGNHMGRYFGRCADPQQAIELSKAVAAVTRQALADAVYRLMELTGKSTMPVLPLILGGDDLLLLVPGKWAVDVARAYAASYEVGMTAAIRQIGVQVLNEAEDGPATVGVGVVMCKSSYPFRMAHTYAEHLLEAAKDDAKAHGRSALCADAILRSDLVTETDDVPIWDGAQMAAVHTARADLARLSNTRLNQIKRAADSANAWAFVAARLERVDPQIAAMVERHKQTLGEADFRHLLKLWAFTHPLNEEEAVDAASI